MNSSKITHFSLSEMNIYNTYIKFDNSSDIAPTIFLSFKSKCINNILFLPKAVTEISYMISLEEFLLVLNKVHSELSSYKKTFEFSVSSILIKKIDHITHDLKFKYKPKTGELYIEWMNFGSGNNKKFVVSLGNFESFYKEIHEEFKRLTTDY